MLLEIAATLVYAGGAAYDEEQTEIGIKKGTFVEGNKFLVGSKPSLFRLTLRNILFFVPMLLMGVFLHPAFLVGPAIAGGIKHYMTGRRAATYNAGRKPRPLETAWRKFLGF